MYVFICFYIIVFILLIGSIKNCCHARFVIILTNRAHCQYPVSYRNRSTIDYLSHMAMQIYPTPNKSITERFWEFLKIIKISSAVWRCVKQIPHSPHCPLPRPLIENASHLSYHSQWPPEWESVSLLVWFRVVLNFSVTYSCPMY